MLSSNERLILGMLGLAALAGLGVCLWQRQRPPLAVTGRPSSAQEAQWDASLQAARRVDVNTATAAELERLPQVGPVLARRIVEDRARRGPFRTDRELTRVDGIGPGTYDALKDYVTAE